MKSELKNMGRSGDLMSSYMSSNSSLSDTFLRDIAMNFLSAGRDTSGVALSWFFWLIFESPHTEANILEELRNVLHGRTRVPLEDLHRLMYLHAALYETLRLYPPVPIHHKAAVHNDTTVKAGTIILYSIYSMARMEWIWRKDCREFRLERWIGEDGALKPGLVFKFMTFNAGPRSCLGQDMAFTLMKIAVATILANFQVVVVEGQNVSPKTSMILSIKNGLKVT
ncbi:cytochrome P450 86A22-like [Amborella trichopoda]|uniref:cytochrome P450 86A22-like n=1 Tax=Amborella trichopoda TaxID=13333 RepID=UPI0009BF67FA|nr:cytochrome P450 86A22-like [Amborella trichopoda]|eukprot:XP_020531001.1 cytochrome P450 86A22-like [Amborella trichopoda]